MIQNKTVMWLGSCPNYDFPPPLPSPPTHAFSKS